MDSIRSISVTEALEQLSYPSFYTGPERKAAYDFVMQWGRLQDKEQAEGFRLKYPFADLQEPDTAGTDANFPIADNALSA
ncbi:MAG: hypothetical protein Q8919_09055 [Bacteroidota bacterium]|nr:hypothetical protein [Bacteroidota bacterium]